MIRVTNPRKEILLVDDDRGVTQMLTMLLETRGYRVNVANNAAEALREVGTSTDLILLDLILPDEEGFEVCRKLKQAHKTKHIPIIMLSAKLLPEDIVEALYLGADDYLTKPFEYEELIARMEAVMRRGSIAQYSSLATKSEGAIVREIRHIIDQGLVVPHFQPIFLLYPFKVLGVEALSRPQTRSVLSNPEFLFKTAIQFGFYQDLEILSWKRAVEYVSKNLKGESLFLNCNPYLVEGPKFFTIKSIFDDCSFDVNNVILEITERSAISNFRVFYDHLKRYRLQGFKFAVDDVGGGYSSLESIVEIKPEVLKIDGHIISDIHRDKYKKSIVKFIVAFCKENHILSIAEGVEKKEDLYTVAELGIDAAQGFYLCEPQAHIDLEQLNSLALI